jgi:hypothetical protein
MLWFILILLLAAIAWLILKPAWAPKPTDPSARLRTSVQKEADRAFHLASDKASQMYEGVAGKLKLRRDKTELAKKFKQWVAEKSLSQQTELYDGLPAQAEGFTAWLAGLSDKDTEAFADKVARFTASLGFDLEWLVNAEVNTQPELKQAIEAAVALYSLAAWRANSVQSEVRAFLAFRAWLANPAKHRALGQKLYSALVQQGLVMPSPDLYLAPEKERMTEAVRAIKQVAETQPGVVNAVLRDLVSQPEKAPQPAAPVPAVA